MSCSPRNRLLFEGSTGISFAVLCAWRRNILEPCPSENLFHPPPPGRRRSSGRCTFSALFLAPRPSLPLFWFCSFAICGPISLRHSNLSLRPVRLFRTHYLTLSRSKSNSQPCFVHVYVWGGGGGGSLTCAHLLERCLGNTAPIEPGIQEA